MSYNSLIAHKDPSAEVKHSEYFRVAVNNEDIVVYRSPVSHYALLSGQGRVQVEIEVKKPFQHVVVRPLKLAVTPRISGGRILFALDAPAKVSVEIDGDIRNPLFLLINPLETGKPDPADPLVRYYRAGKTYDEGLIELAENQTLYIEEGAVVYGLLQAKNAGGIRIRGRGILDGSRWPHEGEQARQRMMLLMGCPDLAIEGITVVNGPTWHLVPVSCSDVRIRDLNIITYTGTGDGIDLVGCRDVTVENCFIRSKDDCIAVKAVDYRFSGFGHGNVENISVSRCVFWNAEWGNALEIGYETRCDEMKEIHFRDCDVIRCEFEGHQSGGTFTIHNGDRANIHHVYYDDIRVEDSREKLIDLKILWSKYAKDQERGLISDVFFNDIQVVGGLFPVSIIRGYDEAHMIENVSIKNLVVHGEKINNANQGKMVAELYRNLQFC